MNEDMSSKEQVHPLERSELDVEKERVAKEIANEISGKKSWRDWLPHFRSKQQIASAAGGFAAGAMSAAGAVNNPASVLMTPIEQEIEVADSAEAIRQMQERNAIDLENYNGQEYPNNPFPVRLDSEIEYNDTTITIDGVSYPRQRNYGSGTINDGINSGDELQGVGSLNITGSYAGILGRRTLNEIDLHGATGPVAEYHQDEVEVIDHMMVIEVDGRTYRFVFSTLSDQLIFGHEGETIDRIVPMTEILSDLAIGRQISVLYSYLTGPMDEYVDRVTPAGAPTPTLVDYIRHLMGTFQLVDRYDEDLLRIEDGTFPQDDFEDTFYLGVIGVMSSASE